MFCRFRSLKYILASVLPWILLLSILPCAYTEEEKKAVLIDPDTLQAMLDRYFEEMDILPDLVSVGYVYTETGETWYHNPDTWYYSASLYKVPLMMLLAEKEAAGELTQESEICGLSLSQVEKEVLTFSNNDIAYSVLLSLGQPDAVRRMYQCYSSIPEEDYPPEFAGYSYFSARFMTDVMRTLYLEPARFPHIADCLLAAQPDHYFRLVLGDKIPIAQKYGRDSDLEGNDWNHTAGIFYTRHPFILTVMTRYGGISETILGDLAAMFHDYSTQLDTRFNEIEAQQEQAARLQETELSVTAVDMQADIQTASPVLPMVSAAPEMLAEETDSFSQTHSVPVANPRVSLILLLSAALLLTVGVFLLHSLRGRKTRSDRRERQR